MVETRNSENGASGFTLLELIIVIAILGLILAALGNGVRFAGQAWQVQERQSSRQGDLDAVQNLVRNLIASGTAFEGDGTSLRFVGALPEALARGGLYEIDLHLVADRLVLTWRPHFKGPDANAHDTETELAKGIGGLDLAYYMGSPGWKTATTDKTKPPELVRLGLLFRDGRAWVPLIAAPMVDVVPAVTN